MKPMKLALESPAPKSVSAMSPNERLESSLSRLESSLSFDGASPVSDRGGDVEEGLLVLSKEERNLLLEVLSETRARRSLGPSWWLSSPCCLCKRRLCCGQSARHKL